MLYMQANMRLGYIYDEHIAIIERLLENGATIQDGHCGQVPSLIKEDAGKGTEEHVGEAPTANSSHLWPNDHLRVD